MAGLTARRAVAAEPSTRAARSPAARAPHLPACAARHTLLGLRPPAGRNAAPPPLSRSRRAQRGPSRALPLMPEVAGEALFEATGVPLLNELMRLRTVDEAVAHSTHLAGVAVVATVVGTLLLTVVQRVAGRRIERLGCDFNVPLAAIAAAFKPAKALLPWYGASYLLTLGSALAQVAAVKLKKQFAALCHGHGDDVLGVLQSFTQLVQDTSELLVIVFLAWAAIDFKNRALGWMATALLSDSNTSNDAGVVLLRPLSGVLTFLILLAAAAFTLGAFGLNLGPLVASVGGVGVVVGLATQRLLGNVVSAVALFTAKPFVVGDEVRLMAAGMLVVSGTVVQMEPMRTMIATDDGGLVYINNAEVTNYIIKNMTQGRSLAVVGAARAEGRIDPPPLVL